MKRLLFLVCAFLFAVAAALQANDPDPLVWFTLYAAAALVCALAALNRIWRNFGLLLACVAFVWAVWIGRDLTLAVPLSTALLDWSMYAEGSEELRELLGLLLVTVATATVAGSSPVSARESEAR